MAQSEVVAATAVAVHRDAWTGVAPEVAALVAPPVVVWRPPVDRPAGAGGGRHRAGPRVGAARVAAGRLPA